MTVLNQGLNTYRDQIQATIATVEIGTGTTPETTSDTALQAPLISVPASTFERPTGEFVTRGRLTASQANGEHLSEVGMKTASTLVTRKTFAPLLKTDLIEVEFEILTRLRNRT
jgi:hypothetical protein